MRGGNTSPVELAEAAAAAREVTSKVLEITPRPAERDVDELAAKPTRMKGSTREAEALNQQFGLPRCWTRRPRSRS